MCGGDTKMCRSHLLVDDILTMSSTFFGPLYGLMFCIILLMVCPSSEAVVNPILLNRAESVFVDYCSHNPPKDKTKIMPFAYSSSEPRSWTPNCAPTESGVGCSCMERIPTIRAKQSRHVETLIDKMSNTRKHYHHLVLMEVITSAITHDFNLKH